MQQLAPVLLRLVNTPHAENAIGEGNAVLIDRPKLSLQPATWLYSSRKRELPMITASNKEGDMIRCLKVAVKRFIQS